LSFFPQPVHSNEIGTEMSPSKKQHEIDAAEVNDRLAGDPQARLAKLGSS
jgi:hypothetical protein